MFISTFYKTYKILFDDKYCFELNKEFTKISRLLAYFLSIMAFDAVSRVTIVPLGRQSEIDIRKARLPSHLEGDEYDPWAHRQPKIILPNWMAYFNMIRLGFGAGILGFPLATSQAGIVCGPIMNISTGIILIHTHLVLMRCLNEISRQLRIPYIPYRYGFRLAVLRGPPVLRWLGRSGPKCVGFFMVLSQLAISTVCVIFTSDSLRDIMDWESHKPATLTLFFPYLLLQYYMKNLKIISYISMAGNFLNLIGISLVFYQIFRSPHGELKMVATEALPVLFAFGTYLFNMSVVGVVLTLDKVIDDPRDITKRYGIIEIGIFFPCMFGTIFGALGYWSFGAMDENILRALPYDSQVTMVAIGLHLVAIAFAYPINIYPATAMILDYLKHHVLDEADQTDAMMSTLDLIIRPCFVIVSFVVSFFIPFQGPFVAMAGNLCTSLLLLVFPALMELCLKYPNDYGTYNFYLVKNLALIIIGLIFATFGAILCSYLIYVRILYASNPREGLL